jgi:hypothetical protein
MRLSSIWVILATTFSRSLGLLMSGDCRSRTIGFVGPAGPLAAALDEAGPC